MFRASAQQDMARYFSILDAAKVAPGLEEVSTAHQERDSRHLCESSKAALALE
jgi:hypothetical protein